MNINKWKALLEIEETEEFIIETKLDLHNQRVIASDVDRTRTSLLSSSEKQDLEKLLTYYCKEFNTSYKQGMNEIMAPFLYLSREGLPLFQVYQCFKSFLHKYLPTMYADQSFKPLQGMFLLFKLLLRYFDPRLSTFFVVNQIEPQTFVTSWFLTLYAGKISSLPTLFYLWEEIIKENDVIFSIFLSIAIILDNKDQIATCTDKIVPQLISQISLEKIDKLSQLISKARNLKKSLPYSILLNLYEFDVFNLENIDNILQSLEKQACLPLAPIEILHRAYPEVEICNCGQSDCEWKTQRGHSIPLVLIDCRTEKHQQQGVLPNSSLLSKSAYTDTEFMMNIPDKFFEMRSIYHFCLMGSNDYQGQNFDLTKVGDASQDIEQNMIENLLQVFLMKGFPFLSVLQGGYLKAHDLALSLEIQLEGHDKSLCESCLKERKKVADDSFKVLKKPKGRLKEKGKKEKELQPPETMKSANEKFLFFCLRVEESDEDPEECMINVSDQWFGISFVSNELVQEVFRVKISGLQQLTILKKDQKMISIKFAEHSKTLIFIMKSIEEAKICVNQIAKYFQMALNFPEMCESPLSTLKYSSRQHSANRLKNLGGAEIQNRDPFTNLIKNSSNKLLPLSPKLKLPKLQVALPPRPSLQIRKVATEAGFSKISCEKDMQENSIKSPTGFPFSKRVKGKRIKMKGSLSNFESSGEKMIKKKRNSVVVLETENDVTFGPVGKIITKDRID